MNCKHELPHLMGTADGIVCRACGRVFASFAEIEAENTPEPVKAVEAAQEAPKPKAKAKAKKKKEGA